jgi:hypothetical protein
VNVANFLTSRGVNSQVVIVRSVAVADARLTDHHPRIVVTKDASIFLVACRVGGNLAKFQVVLRIGGLLKDDAVLGGEMQSRGIQSANGETILQSNPRESAEALRLDKDLPFCALLRADLAARVVISSEEPFAIPAILADGGFHLLHFRKIGAGFSLVAEMAGYLRELTPSEHK